MRTLLISLVLISSFAYAKVAYLPIHDHDYGLMRVGKWMVLDIDTGEVLKYINSPFEFHQDFFINNAVVLNNSGTKLFIQGAYRIAQIDTTTLEVERIYDTNGALFIDMFLNQSEDKMYTFGATGNVGSSVVTEIDLNNNSTNVALHFGRERIRDYYINDSLTTVVFTTDDRFPRTISRMRVVDIDTMTETFVHDYGILFPPQIKMIDNNGIDYYYVEGTQFFSAKLSDHSINWVFDRPFEQVKKVYENNDGTITAIASNTSYIINKNTGLGDTFSDFGAIDFSNNVGSSLDSLNRIDNENYFAFNYPSLNCTGTNCTLDSVFTISTIHLPSNSVSTIFQDGTMEGTDAIGKYIGEKFYSQSIRIIPVLNNPISILLLLGLILRLAYKKRFV